MVDASRSAPGVSAVSPADWFDAGCDRFVSLTPLIWGPIGRDAVDTAAPRRGDRVLDACCGAGASALPLAQAVGPTGHVDAIDSAPRLIEVGRTAAVAMNLDQLVFDVGDATSWERPGPRYDHLVCVLGVFFLPDMTAGTKRLLAHLRPGGRVVITVWAETGVQPIGDALRGALRRVAPERFGERTHPIDVEQIRRHDGLLDWARRDLGLIGTVIFDHPRQIVIDSATAWALCTGTVFAALLDGLSQHDRDRVRLAVDDAMSAADWRLDISTRQLVARRSDRFEEAL